GASDVSLSFDEPNKTSIDNIHIETGVSKFYGRNLGNANFNHLRFEGGVGSYTLDFSGDLTHEVDVDVEVGLGALTIIVPKDVGARVLFQESWVSRLDTDRDFQPSGRDQYQTDNYNAARGKMNIRIDAGLGSVKIRRK
ncbi:MAG: cell wall-active antibiotics response protein, partial [Ignavibacteria bacterium]|nr:cell wall-active antibiotics response protein [Ignavibacteria bacterium]